MTVTSEGNKDALYCFETHVNEGIDMKVLSRSSYSKQHTIPALSRSDNARLWMYTTRWGRRPNYAGWHLLVCIPHAFLWHILTPKPCLAVTRGAPAACTMAFVVGMGGLKIPTSTAHQRRPPVDLAQGLHTQFQQG